MSNEIYIAVFVSIAVIAAGVGFVAFDKRRSATVLRKWAAENNFEVLRSERSLSSGAFCWLASVKTSVFFVTVRDRESRERSGWVRCGSPFEGVLFSDKAEVKWKEP
jgi:hypothetical protein